MRHIALILSLLLAVPIHGSLSFSSTNQMNTGQAAPLDDIMGTTSPAGDQTTLTWIKCAAAPNDAVIYQKGTFGGANADALFFEFTSGDLISHYDRTSDLTAEAAMANFANWGTAKWVYVVSRSKAAGANGDQQLLIGDENAAAAQPSSYATQIVGSGDHTTNGSADHIVGNEPGLGTPLTCEMFAFARYNVYLDTTQIEAQRKIFNCGNYPVQARACFVLGIGNSVGDQTDFSGNGNTGVVTGATATAMPPIPYNATPGVLSIHADAVKHKRDDRGEP